jgi:hypothetical protein
VGGSGISERREHGILPDPHIIAKTWQKRNYHVKVMLQKGFSGRREADSGGWRYPRACGKASGFHQIVTIGANRRCRLTSQTPLRPRGPGRRGRLRSPRANNPFVESLPSARGGRWPRNRVPSHTGESRVCIAGSPSRFLSSFNDIPANSPSVKRVASDPRRQRCFWPGALPVSGKRLTRSVKWSNLRAPSGAAILTLAGCPPLKGSRELPEQSPGAQAR